MALVVGVKDDIGSATAEMMAKESAKVVVAKRNYVIGKTLVDKVLAVKGEAIY